jgi:hypothetical protein
VENADTEDKLGQPMVQLTLTRDWGTVDFFLMSGSRERTFAGSDGRLRPPLPISGTRFTSIEANRRWRSTREIRVEARFFSNVDADDPAFALRDDDYLQVEYVHFF